MGIPPDIYNLNNYCPRCFPVGESPHRLILSVGGIEKSDNFPGITESPPNGMCYCFQTPGDCEWYGSAGVIDWAAVSWQAVQSQVTVRVPGVIDGFIQTVAEICERHFTNSHQNPAIFAYNFGHAVIMSAAEIVAVINSHLPFFEEGAWFEIIPSEDRMVGIRYANRIHRQNILIKFDIDEIL